MPMLLVLLIAALSSTIAIMEVLIANLLEASHGKLNRHQAVLVAVAISLVLGVSGAFSLSGKWAVLTFDGRTLFDWFDVLVTDILLPIGAFAMALFVGWVMPKRYNDFIPVSQKPWKRFFRPVFIFSLRWIVPVAILLILLHGFGILD